MFAVTGFWDGIPYRVVLDAAPGSSPARDAAPEAVIVRLWAREGQPWLATPTGPAGTLDMSDPSSILGALLGWTEVRSVTGDPPAIQGWRPVVQPGAVY